MKRYFKLYYQILKINLMRQVEFRFNTAIWTVINLIWLFLSITFVNLIFGQIDSIAGWNKQEVLVLAVIHGLFFDLLWGLIFPNLDQFSRLIRKGELDLVLLRPVSPRFLVSFRHVGFDHSAGALVKTFLLIKFLGEMSTIPSLLNWLNFFGLMLTGLVIFYCAFFMVTVTNFWFMRLFNLVDFFDSVADIGRTPVYVFKENVRWVFLYVIPVAYVSTYPAMALFGRIGFDKIPIGVLLAIILFFLSNWFWKFALKRYSSASS